MTNYFIDKYGDLKAWVIRNGKRVLVTLIVLAVIIAGGLILYKNEAPQLGGSTVTVGDWGCYYSITATSTISGTHSNFPVLIDPSDAPTNIGDCAFKADATDIRVSTTSPASGGSIPILNQEVASSTEVWVNVPSLSSSTVLYVLMDNPSASDISTTDTWNSDYKMVHHMNESSGNIIDSTSNNHDSNSVEGDPTYQQTGKLGYSINVDGSDSFTIPDSTDWDFGSSEFTIKFWTKTSNTGDQHIAATGCRSPNTCWYVKQSDGFNQGWSLGGVDSGEWNSAVKTADGTWHHIVFTRVSNTLYLYDNGSSGNSTSISSMVGSISNLTIGKSTDIYWNGNIDEFSILHNGLSADWIDAEYKNQLDPTLFWATGSAVSTAVGTNMKINIGDAWKDIEAMKININDTWKPIEGAWINIGDSWKAIY